MAIEATEIEQLIRDEFPDAQITREPHLEFKTRVPNAIGLIRTGDPTAYGNVIVESV